MVDKRGQLGNPEFSLTEQQMHAWERGFEVWAPHDLLEYGSRKGSEGRGPHFPG